MTRHVLGFVAGFLAPWRGISIIASDARIARFAVLPFLLIVLFFGTGLAIGLPIITSWVNPTTAWLLGVFGLPSASTTYSILSWLIPIALWPTLALALCLMIWISARLCAGPLFTLLAEAVLVSRGALERPPFSLVAWTATNVQMLRVSLVRTLVFGLIGAVLVVLSLLPLIGIFAGLALLVILAFDLSDYALEAYEWGFRERIGFYLRHFPVFLGMALMLGLVFLIPGLNFFLLPASVAGASDVVRRLMLSESR